VVCRNARGTPLWGSEVRIGNRNRYLYFDLYFIILFIFLVLQAFSQRTNPNMGKANLHRTDATVETRCAHLKVRPKAGASDRPRAWPPFQTFRTIPFQSSTQMAAKHTST
jgi:hypothetical protein